MLWGQIRFDFGRLDPDPDPGGEKMDSKKTVLQIVMFIPDPDLYLSRITDHGSRIQKQQEKRGVKKN